MNSSKILLVDDDEDILDLLEYNLTNEGYIVQTALNGKKAIEVANEFIPDLIILDVMMPEMDGYELSRTLRQRGFDGPIVAVTAAVIGDETEKLKEAGVDVVLAKPISMSRLKAELNLLTSKGS